MLGKRVFRYLDAAYARGAFGVSGSFIGLSAEAIADEIAAAWDGENARRGSFRAIAIPGTSKLTAEDVRPHVEKWMSLNEIVAGIRE